MRAKRGLHENITSHNKGWVGFYCVGQRGKGFNQRMSVYQCCAIGHRGTLFYTT